MNAKNLKTRRDHMIWNSLNHSPTKGIMIAAVIDPGINSKTSISGRPS
jgi:hypothetical protein